MMVEMVWTFEEDPKIILERRKGKPREQRVE